MDLGTGMTRTRCALVWGLATATTAGLVAWLGPVAAGGEEVAGQVEAQVGFEAALVRLCAVVATVVAVWLWMAATLVTADAVRGRGRPRRGVPEGLRRGVLLLCGVAVTAGLVSPASAAGDPALDTAPDPGVLAGLRLPERVAVRPVAHAAVPAPAPAPAPAAGPARGHVEVRPGDSLWSIAAERLGPGATAGAVAAAWPVLYAANRDVIGANPDCIEPGQRLVLPDEDGAR